VPIQPDSRYTVKGNPYISVNRATMNAEKAPRLRQSRALRGFVKLNAKRMNARELRRTRVQRP
jgi:hypothetical protein